MAIKVILSGDIHLHFHSDSDSQNNEAIAAISRKLDLVLKNQSIMATQFSELKTEFDALKTAITVERQQILDKLAAADAKVVELEALVVAGGTEEDRATLLSEIRALIGEVKDIIPDTPPVEG